MILEIENCTPYIMESESLFMYDKEVSSLKESLGAFKDQYKYADAIADKVYSCIVDGKRETEYNLVIDNSIIPLKISIFITTSTTKAETSPCENYGYQIIFMINNYNRIFKSDEELKQEISSVITHELNHIYVFYSQDDGEENMLWYQNVKKLIEDEYVDKDIRYFAYMLYMAYYKEAQAFVSMAYKEVKNMMGDSPITTENIYKCIQKTTPYKIYSRALTDWIPYFQEKDSESLTADLKSHGIDIKNIKKQLEFFDRKFKKVLKDTFRNASLIVNKENL